MNKKLVSSMLVAVMVSQLLTGCASINTDTIINALPEDYIHHRVAKELNIDTDKLKPSYIKEHLSLDKGLYQFKVDNEVVAESYTINTTVSGDSKAEIEKQLPDSMKDYDIDWPAVIGKFAIGTGVIIVVVAVTGLTDGTTYFIGVSPESIATQAVVGAAVGGALQNVIASVKEGKPLPAGVMKRSIEGAADGFMWCAVSGALLPLPDLQEKFEILKYVPADKLNIKLASGVYDKAGRRVGEAIYATGKDVMDSEPRKRIDEFVNKASKYTPPINSELILGTGEKVWTDSTGAIYRVGDKLLPDIKFSIDGNWFETDKLGRIVQIDYDKYSFSNLAAATSKMGKSTADAISNAAKKTADAGRNVGGSIKLHYNDASNKASEFLYSFTNGGKKEEKVVKNEE